MREAQWALLRRARIPNLSLSFTAQSDGFSERVLGGGLSIPLPLPEPLGPSRGGEIAAAATAVSEAQVLVGKREREVGLEVRRAHHAVLAAERSLAEVPADLIHPRRPICGRLPRPFAAVGWPCARRCCGSADFGTAAATPAGSSRAGPVAHRAATGGGAADPAWGQRCPNECGAGRAAMKTRSVERVGGKTACPGLALSLFAVALVVPQGGCSSCGRGSPEGGRLRPRSTATSRRRMRVCRPGDALARGGEGGRHSDAAGGVQAASHRRGGG